MAFQRRSFNFSRGPRRRAFSTGGRFRRGLKDPQRTKGLEVASIFIDEQTTVANSSAALAQVYTNIAALALSVGNTTGAESPETRVGNVLGASWRYIQINGIVLDWGIEQMHWSGEDASPEQNHVWTRFELLTDRIDMSASDSPTPASLASYNPFSNTWPVSVLGAAAPSFGARQQTFPTRIHYSKTDFNYVGASEVVLPLEGALYVPSGQKVRNRNATINRRLRIRVDDEHGFFLGWHIGNAATFSVSATEPRIFRRWAVGRLFYRVRQ